MPLRKQAEGLTPIRLVSSTGKRLTHPIFVEVECEFHPNFPLKLEPDTACIYAIGLGSFDNVVIVGQTEQLNPRSRINSGYADRVRTQKYDTAVTIQRLQDYALTLPRGQKLRLFVKRLEVCTEDVRLKREKEHIESARKVNPDLFNAT